MGLEKKTIKHKQGWLWHHEGISAELCEVSGFINNSSIKHSPEKQGCIKNLGWFLELEILANDDSADTIIAAREKLLNLLEKTGIGKENIESRYYAELLDD